MESAPPPKTAMDGAGAGAGARRDQAELNEQELHVWQQLLESHPQLYAQDPTVPPPPPPPPHHHPHPPNHQQLHHQQHQQHQPPPQAVEVPRNAKVPGDASEYDDLGAIFSMFAVNSADDDLHVPPTAPGSGAANGVELAPNDHTRAMAIAENPLMHNGLSHHHHHQHQVPTQHQQHQQQQQLQQPTQQQQQQQHQHLTAMNQEKVLLPRSSSSSSNPLDTFSPKSLTYPSFSPASMNVFQSLVNSASCDSLTGLASPSLFNFNSASSTPQQPAASLGNSTGDQESITGLVRTPSCEIIDWKAYNEGTGAPEKAPKDSKWRVIPQHGPHSAPAGVNLPPKPSLDSNLQNGPASADETNGIRDHLARQFQSFTSTVASIVSAVSPKSEQVGVTDTTAGFAVGAPDGIPFNPSEVLLGTQPTLHDPSAMLPPQAIPRMDADTVEKNKRKAIISPEYVQYGNAVPEEVPKNDEHLRVGTLVEDPTGRRPSKKTIQQAVPVPGDQAPHFEAIKEETATLTSPTSDSVRCKCTGKCRNARCVCVKAGFVCGEHCKCTGCANPFVAMAACGINLQKMIQDVCLMQYLSKVKDMSELLESTVAYECCQGVVKVKEVAQDGFECPKCHAHYTYSWCNHKLCHDDKKPRNHCQKCRRCGDHRNVHCDDCNHCYFAGVANSFACSCKTSKNSRSRLGVPNTMVSTPEKPVVSDETNPVNESADSRVSAVPAIAESTGEDGEKEDGCRVQ